MQPILHIQPGASLTFFKPTSRSVKPSVVNNKRAGKPCSTTDKLKTHKRAKRHGSNAPCFKSFTMSISRETIILGA